MRALRRAGAETDVQDDLHGRPGQPAGADERGLREVPAGVPLGGGADHAGRRADRRPDDQCRQGERDVGEGSEEDHV